MNINNNNSYVYICFYIQIIFENLYVSNNFENFSFTYYYG